MIGWVFVVGEGFGVLGYDLFFFFFNSLLLQVGHFLVFKTWVPFHLFYFCSLAYSPMGMIMQSWP